MSDSSCWVGYDHSHALSLLEGRCPLHWNLDRALVESGLAGSQNVHLAGTNLPQPASTGVRALLDRLSLSAGRLLPDRPRPGRGGTEADRGLSSARILLLSPRGSAR